MKLKLWKIWQIQIYFFLFMHNFVLFHIKLKWQLFLHLNSIDRNVKCNKIINRSQILSCCFEVEILHFCLSTKERIRRVLCPKDRIKSTNINVRKIFVLSFHSFIFILISGFFDYWKNLCLLSKCNSIEYFTFGHWKHSRGISKTRFNVFMNWSEIKHCNQGK